MLLNTKIALFVKYSYEFLGVQICGGLVFRKSTLISLSSFLLSFNFSLSFSFVLYNISFFYFLTISLFISISHYNSHYSNRNLSFRSYFHFSFLFPFFLFFSYFFNITFQIYIFFKNIKSTQRKFKECILSLYHAKDSEFDTNSNEDKL